MAMPVVAGAQIMCTFGMAPSALLVLPDKKVLVENRPAATIMDYTPMKNILPFGMCTSLANPQVAAATTAALGVLTPMPCVPNVVAPWVPGAPTVLIGNQPALNNTSKCMCLWAGVISVLNPGAVKEQVP